MAGVVGGRGNQVDAATQTSATQTAATQTSATQTSAAQETVNNLYIEFINPDTTDPQLVLPSPVIIRKGEIFFFIFHVKLGEKSRKYTELDKEKVNYELIVTDQRGLNTLLTLARRDEVELSWNKDKWGNLIIENLSINSLKPGKYLFKMKVAIPSMERTGFRAKPFELVEEDKNKEKDQQQTDTTKRKSPPTREEDPPAKKQDPPTERQDPPTERQTRTTRRGTRT